MSHRPIVISAQGTPIEERSVGELVAEQPGRSRVFQEYEIDFCCKGGQTVRQACENRAVALEELIGKLEAEDVGSAVSAGNPAELPPSELADYIIERHHGYLRTELPRLHAMAQRVAQVHGGHTTSLVQVFNIFCELFVELDSHMRKEEEILFPAVSALCCGAKPPIPMGGPISQMMEEHEEAGAALRQLRELTHGYQPPSEACNTWRALFSGLADLEGDLHKHIHLENHVLFPAANRLTA